MKVGDRTFKNHLDGYNFLPYFKGEVAKGPRGEFFCLIDSGDLYAVRYHDWKIRFKTVGATGSTAARGSRTRRWSRTCGWTSGSATSRRAASGRNQRGRPISPIRFPGRTVPHIPASRPADILEMGRIRSAFLLSLRPKRNTGNGP